MSYRAKNIMVTGGAGYVGAVLIPKLVNHGYNVTVLDLMMYGEDVYDSSDFDRSKLTIIKGDIRDLGSVTKSLENKIDTVIHLACISNDPSVDLNPELGKSINLDCFRPLVEKAIEMGVERFIYASSSSVYGIKKAPKVVEEMSLEPLTDYSKFKAECEVILDEYESQLTTCTIRPATVCGYSPRQRLDVIVNILTNHAFHNRKILVFGGEQKRPNIHIQDMTDLYLQLLKEPAVKIHRQIYNAGYENFTVNELSGFVKDMIGRDVLIEKKATDDNRSYHVSSEKIFKDIGFKAIYSIEDAVKELREAFESGKLVDPMNNIRYSNIRTMKKIGLT